MNVEVIVRRIPTFARKVDPSRELELDPRHLALLHDNRVSLSLVFGAFGRSDGISARRKSGPEGSVGIELASSCVRVRDLLMPVPHRLQSRQTRDPTVGGTFPQSENTVSASSGMMARPSSSSSSTRAGIFSPVVASRMVNSRMPGCSRLVPVGSHPPIDTSRSSWINAVSETLERTNHRTMCSTSVVLRNNGIPNNRRFGPPAQAGRRRQRGGRGGQH